MVDGVDVQDWDMEALRRRIAVVPQKAVLFRGTIRSNLLWGREDATQAELQVLDEAGNVVASAPCRTYFQQWAAPNFDAADAPVPQRLIYLMLWDDGSTDRAYDTRADQLVGQGAEPGRGASALVWRCPSLW